jgi:hypothetical protein
VVWEYEVPLFDQPKKGAHGPEAWGKSVFSATRLANGNTLIGAGNGHSLLEVTPETVVDRLLASPHYGEQRRRCSCIAAAGSYGPGAHARALPQAIPPAASARPAKPVANRPERLKVRRSSRRAFLRILLRRNPFPD